MRAPQKLELTLSFHPFRDRGQAKGAREVDDGSDEDLAGTVVEHLRDEAAIDLECVNRQLRQPAQRRVARSEVINGDPDSCSTQTLELGYFRGQLLMQGPFRDLDIESRER